MSTGKRLSTDRPLTEHDVAERLDRAALRVLNILTDARAAGIQTAVGGSRYLAANALESLTEELDVWTRARRGLVTAVHVILVDPNNGRVLLTRRAGTGYEDGCWSLPAGHLDGAEPARSAAAREVREETGVTVDPDDLLFLHVMHRLTPDDERTDYFFQANRWQGEPSITEPDKCDAQMWADLAGLPDNTVPYVAHAVTLANNWKPYSEYGWDGRPR